MSGEPHIISLADCAAESAPLVGGKATGLGALLREGFRVPPGFAITTTAYREHRAHNRLAAALAEEIRAAYERLCGPTGPVAVRSSATAEDLADASFAGQQETYLWVIGAEQVLQHVLRCWASLFTPQAIAYRQHRRITEDADLAMGVIVQAMVPAEAAGVMLTIDPLNGDHSAIVIEASYGLGAAVVNGEVTPDRFCVDKVLLEIRSRTIGRKTMAYRFDSHAQGTALAPVPPEAQSQPSITDEEVRQLATLGKRLEQTMGRPQDIEWAIGPGREIHLLQARPETVWSQKPRTPLAKPSTPAIERVVRTMYARKTE